MAYSRNNTKSLDTRTNQATNTGNVTTDLTIDTNTFTSISTPSIDAVLDRDQVTYTDTINLGPEVSSKKLSTTFGREEDYVELHIKNTADQLIYSETNFQDYTLEDNNTSISINPEKILSDRGYISGEYIFFAIIFNL